MNKCDVAAWEREVRDPLGRNGVTIFEGRVSPDLLDRGWRAEDPL
jgi:hypothetical protein